MFIFATVLNIQPLFSQNNNLTHDCFGKAGESQLTDWWNNPEERIIALNDSAHERKINLFVCNSLHQSESSRKWNKLEVTVAILSIALLQIVLKVEY